MLLNYIDRVFDGVDGAQLIFGNPDFELILGIDCAFENREGIEFQIALVRCIVGNLFRGNARNPRDRMLDYRSNLVIRHDFSQDRRAKENDKTHTLTEARSQSSTAMIIQTRGQHMPRPSW